MNLNSTKLCHLRKIHFTDLKSFKKIKKTGTKHVNDYIARTGIKKTDALEIIPKLIKCGGFDDGDKSSLKNILNKLIEKHMGAHSGIVIQMLSKNNRTWKIYLEDIELMLHKMYCDDEKIYMGSELNTLYEKLC